MLRCWLKRRWNKVVNIDPTYSRAELTPEELSELQKLVQENKKRESIHRSSVAQQATSPGLETSNQQESVSAEVPAEEEKSRTSDEQASVLNFKDSAELILFFDPDLNNGTVTLHPWQIEISEFLCHSKPTAQHPLKFALCAANGSGKDQFVIAPFAIWFCLCKKRSRVVITSSSGVQLTNQTEKYISDLATRINLWFLDKFGEKNIFNITQRKIECRLTGSIIQMFATDEEGKAEGYHPLEPNAEFAIIPNEAKSILPEIFRALRRCTGYNYWIDVSSPGEPNGDFYNHYNGWKNKRRVTFFDCPHLSRDDFDDDRKELGEHSPLFRSKWLALFTSFGGNFVIQESALSRLKRFLDKKLIDEKFIDWPLRIGIDLAAGGDESVISVWRGNKQIGLDTSREVDTTKTADWIAEKLSSKYKLPYLHEYIFADDGGIGHGIIDQLVRRGWNIKRVKNNSPARDKKSFKNRGAELWFKMARMVEEAVIIPLQDEKQWEQFGQRRYKKEDVSGKVGLERKAEAIADGLASPDRADAAVLAFTDVSLQDILAENYPSNPTGRAAVKRRYTSEQVDDLFYGQEFPEWDTHSEKQDKYAHMSLSVIMSRNSQNNRQSPLMTYARPSSNTRKQNAKRRAFSVVE